MRGAAQLAATFLTLYMLQIQLTGARVYNPTVSTRELQAGHSLSAAATAPETVQPNVIAWLDKGMHAHRAIVEGLSAAGASLKTHDSGYLHHWEF